jgi:carbohydrate-selective porin OprB
VDRDDQVSAWSIGFSQAFPTPGVENLVSEKVIETFYRWQITNNLALSPDFQLIFGSGGLTSRGVHTVYGVRLFLGY